MTSVKLSPSISSLSSWFWVNNDYPDDILCPSDLDIGNRNQMNPEQVHFGLTLKAIPTGVAFMIGLDHILIPLPKREGPGEGVTK
jgi:hypothetical protein